jgi:hypothetical protein
MNPTMKHDGCLRVNTGAEYAAATIGVLERIKDLFASLVVLEFNQGLP